MATKIPTLLLLTTTLTPWVVQQSERYTRVADKVVVIVDRLEKEAKLASNVTLFTEGDAWCKTNGYCHMHPKVAVTAWDKAFLYLERHPADKAVWLVEYDVYVHHVDALPQLDRQHSKADLILPMLPKIPHGQRAVVQKALWSKKEDPHWPWWREGNGMGAQNNLVHNITQLCRLSPKLIQHCLRWRRQHKRFHFHEILLPTLVKRHQLSHALIRSPHIRWGPRYTIHHMKRLCAKNKNKIATILHPIKTTERVAWLP